MDKVKVAILGTGTIANKLAKAFSITPNASLHAVASRDIKKAAAFSEKYNIPKAYGSYLDAIKDSEVQLVYIALPHPFHYAMAKESLACGKNVLCEKPLTVNAKEAEALFALAKEKNLFFSEAMWTRFLPSVKTVTEIIKNGKIGTIKEIISSVAHDSRHIHRMTDPLLAGGMLLDCGIYLITSVFLLSGKDFSSISTSATLSDEGVDLHSTTILTYPDGASATMFMAMDKNGDNKITIIGDSGTIEMDVVYNWQNIKLTNAEGATSIPIPPQEAGGFEYMTKAVCNAILQGKTHCDELSPQDTLSVMQLMDTIRNCWGLKYPFE